MGGTIQPHARAVLDGVMTMITERGILRAELQAKLRVANPNEALKLLALDEAKQAPLMTAEEISTMRLRIAAAQEATRALRSR